MTTLSGIGTSPLSGVGHARWYRPDAAITLPERPAAEEVDSGAEQVRFETARGTVREALKQARDQTAERVGEQEAAVFEAHQQFLDDPQLVEDIERSIQSGMLAPHAVADRFEEAIKQFENMDGMMAERAADLRDVRDRLLRELLDVEGADLSTLPPDTVVLAKRLTPSDTAKLDPEAIAGVVSATGGRTSHAAILTRALAIPAVVGVGEELFEVAEGTEVLVDGEADELVTEPGASRRAEADSLDASIRTQRVTTADERAIEVAANVGSVMEFEPARARGADGVGLFRMEFLFLDREEPPDEEEQYEAVSEALAAFPDNRVVVRTLDVGGDKAVSYLDMPAETNPFLGQRGLRLSLGKFTDLFETQLRALLRAAASDNGDKLAIMFPMITHMDEVEAALARVEAIANDLASEGIKHAIPELGIMIETPAGVFSADRFAGRLDFLSIGTNDLTQYVMAADRENNAVADLHDPLYPAVLRAIDYAVTAADKHDAWVGMCGEMAGNPELTELLIGLGLDELSMSAVSVPAVKKQVINTDTHSAKELAADVLNCQSREDVYETLDLS